MKENKKRQEKAELIRRVDWCIAMFLGATITLVITVNTNCTLNLVLGTSCIILIALLGMFTNAAQYDDIKLEPLPEPLDEAIRSNHGDDLATVMEAIRREPLEHWAVFDEDGDKLAEGTLHSSFECNLAPCDQWAIQYAEVNVHNHPNIGERSFSNADMRMMIAYSTHRSLVVTRNYTYSMENPYWEDEEYPFDESDFQAFVDKKYEYSIFTKLLCLIPAFTRWRTIYISYSVARHFGLKFHVQNHRLDYIKTHLWTRRVQQSITRYAAILGTAIIMLAPSTSSGYATSVIVCNSITQDIIKAIPEQELTYDENYDYASEIEEKSSVADGEFQPVEPF